MANDTTKRFTVTVYFWTGGSRAVLHTDKEDMAIQELNAYSDAARVAVWNNETNELQASRGGAVLS